MAKNAMVKKPMGPSKLGSFGGSQWNNHHWGTDGPILCEICGTTHPERKEETYTVSIFLGHQVVEECCGEILDKIYQESGEEFAIAFLEEFAQNPTSPRFSMLLVTLEEVCRKAQEVAEETAKKLHVDHLRLAPVMEITKKRV